MLAWYSEHPYRLGLTGFPVVECLDAYIQSAAFMAYILDSRCLFCQRFPRRTVLPKGGLPAWRAKLVCRPSMLERPHLTPSRHLGSRPLQPLLPLAGKTTCDEQKRAF